MIQNYQQNELPSIKTLEQMNHSYDKIIEETKAYTEIK